MKGLILYRSWFGNTQKAADYMAGQLKEKGHDTAARDLREKLPHLDGIDFIIIGAPTRMAGVTGKATGIIKQLKKANFTGPVAIFDLYGPIPADPAEYEKGKRWLIPGAIGKMHDEAKKQGLALYPGVLRLEVTGLEGPLKDGELQKASAWLEGFTAWAGK